MVGGAFLCFEGFEKVAHKLWPHKEADAAHHREHLEALVDPAIDIVEFERDKIRGAIRTDIILSAEIIVITLGTVAGEPFGKQVIVLGTIAVLITVGVYGFVAGIVKLDDAGLALSKRADVASRALGRTILWSAPYLMKGLGIAGTVAMFLVGGGILAHGVPPLHHFSEHLQQTAGPWGWAAGTAIDGLTGIVAGGLILGIVAIVNRLRSRQPHRQA
jgi:hypothetical protein